jgi:hypothetical protein
LDCIFDSLPLDKAWQVDETAILCLRGWTILIGGLHGSSPNLFGITMTG